MSGASPARVRCAPWVSWGPSEAELMLFDSQDGSYHLLNGSAAQIWLALSEGHQPAEIGGLLAGRHGVEPALVAPDVEAFVAQALAKNLLVAE